jgi:Skp family chaperone for outer membrane proteins
MNNNCWLKPQVCRIALALTALLVAVPTAHAQPKIGVIDLQTVFDKYYKTEQAGAALKERGAEFEKTRQDLLDQYGKANEDYRKLAGAANDPALSIEERDKRKADAESKLREIKGMEDHLRRFARETQGAVDDQIERTRETILREIREKITTTATAQGYTLVLDTAARSANRTPIVLYTNREHDITEEILHQLNAMAPVKSPDTASNAKSSNDKAAKK